MVRDGQGVSAMQAVVELPRGVGRPGKAAQPDRDLAIGAFGQDGTANILQSGQGEFGRRLTPPPAAATCGSHKGWHII